MKESLESMDKLIHKKKEAKKKQKAKGLLPIGLKENTLNGQQMQMPNEQQSKAKRTKAQIHNQMIDELLEDLINTGLIKEEYTPYYAKAMHIIGINKVNQLAIKARNGTTPEKLFAYKVKGAMQLHFKASYYSEV